MMSPIESISSVFRNYINFRGRAQRSEFWWFALLIVASKIILNFIPAPFAGTAFLLAVLLPSLTVTARRLHDTGRPVRWWIIILLAGFLGTIALIVFMFWAATWGEGYGSDEYIWGILIIFLAWLLVSGVGVIVLLILCALPGTTGPNSYGPDPLRLELGDDSIPRPAHPYDAPPAEGVLGPSRYDATPPESPPESGQDNQRYCTQCGMELRAEAQFCISCGATL